MWVYIMFLNEHFIYYTLSDIDISNRSNSILNLLISFKKIRGRDSSSKSEGFHEGSTWWIYYDEINIFMRMVFNMNYNIQYYHIYEGIIWIFVTSYFITNNNKDYIYNSNKSLITIKNLRN